MKPSKKKLEGKGWRRARWGTPEEPSPQRVAERMPGVEREHSLRAYSLPIGPLFYPVLPLALDNYVQRKNEGVRAWQNSHHLLPQSGKAVHQAEAATGHINRDMICRKWE